MVRSASCSVEETVQAPGGRGLIARMGLVVGGDQQGGELVHGLHIGLALQPAGQQLALVDGLDQFAPALGNGGQQRQLQLREARRDAERQRMREVLEQVQGDQRRACEILGISRATLWRRLRDSR